MTVMRASGVVMRESELHGSKRGHGARQPDHATRLRHVHRCAHPGEFAAHIALARAQLVARRRIGVQMSFGHAHAAHLQRNCGFRMLAAEHEFGRTTAQIDDQKRAVAPAQAQSRTVKRQARLGVAAQQLRSHAEGAFRRVEERGAIARIAGSASGHRPHTSHAMRLHSRSVLRQHGDGARDRFRQKLAGHVDALTQTRHAHRPFELAPRRIGDEKPYRVRTDVDRGQRAQMPCPPI